MVCERHEEVIDMIDDHEDRIKTLELADVENRLQIKNLVEHMAKLVATMERFMGYAWKILLSVASGGILFIIWYIQK